MHAAAAGRTDPGFKLAEIISQVGIKSHHELWSETAYAAFNGLKVLDLYHMHIKYKEKSFVLDRKRRSKKDRNSRGRESNLQRTAAGRDGSCAMEFT